MIPVPTFRELAEKATKSFSVNPDGYVQRHTEIMVSGPNREALRTYLLRCDPATMLAVYEALEHMRDEMLAAAERTGVGELAKQTKSWRVTTRALRLLDGVTDGAGET